MGGSNFNLIAQELLKQKQMMDELEVENRDLRQQLANLREGRGISIEIAGQRFALNGQLTQQEDAQVLSPDPIETPAPNTTIPLTPPLIAIDMPTIITELSAEEIAQINTPEEEKQKATPFLEEIMLDEFATALTSPLAVWQGPEKKQEQIDDEQKAALRRELMGSYLLE